MFALFCIPWAANAQETLTVHDGTNTSSYIPHWGLWADNGLQSEMVYPATELSDMTGSSITNLHYYSNGTSNITSWNGTCQIFMMEIESTSLSEFAGPTDATVVYNGPIALVNGEMTIELSTPYNYGGGNLLVGFYYTTGGSYASVYWLGDTVSGASIYGRSGNSYSVTAGDFLPKTTFTYTPEGDYCPKPRNVAANNITAHTAVMTWDYLEEAEDGYKYLYWKASEEEPSIVETTSDNTVTLTGLDPETTYNFEIYTACADMDFESTPVTVSFTTPIACPAPTGLAYSDITANSVALNWTGTSNSYNVSYRTAAYAEGVYEQFNNSGLPSGWTRYSGLVDEVLDGTATLATTTSGWNTNTYALGSYNMKVNIYGTSIKYWLVTPEFILDQNLSFDLALTDFGNSDPIEDNTAQADDRFVVLIYANNAWTILREWNNSGSDYVYNNISSTGENVTIDLSAYDGQNVKIAFYGESTAAGGDNDLHIDNVFCGTPIPAGEWQTVTANASPATITGLAPETKYEVKVQGDCGEDGLSAETNIVTFTTAAECPVPTGLTYANVTAHEATISWASLGAAAWQIQLGEETPIDVTEPTYTFTGLVPETPYSVKVRTNCDGVYTDWTNAVSFTTGIACPAPTGLAATLTPGDGSVATLNWTSEASAWVVAYKTAADEEFTEVNVTENPFTLTGLTAETDYTAKVKAVCGGEDGESQWSSTITFTPTDAFTLTVNDGTSTNGNVPIYGYWCDNITKSQFIIPAGDLASMQWGTINKLTFYSSNASVNWGAATFEVYMTETSETTLSALADYTTMEKVMNAGTLSISGNKMVVELNAPYQYLGGNLMIGFLQTVSGSYSSCSWYGVSAASGASYGGYGTSVNAQSFLPKITFFYEPGEEPACQKPTGVTYTDVTPHEATVTWTSDASAWQIQLGEEDPVDVEEATYTFTGLVPEASYSVKVRANCNGTFSEWTSPVSITTGIACPAPTGLAATLTPGDGSVATLNWTSEASAWVVAYKTAADEEFTEVNVTENPFTLTGLTAETDYTAKVKAVCGGEDGESQWSSTITFTPTDAFTLTVNDGTSTNGNVPIYGYWCDNITKSQFIIPAGDLASMQWGTINKLTFYSSNASVNWGAATFEVYMTETSETTLSALADYTTMEKVMNAGTLSISGNKMVVELNAPYQYLGGNLMIGFLQTVSGSYSSCSWYGVSAASGASYGGYGTSVNAQSFLPKITFFYEPGEEPACQKPTGVTVSYEGGTEATISWTSDATAWNMRVNGTEINGTITNPYTLTGLDLATTYEVEVQANCGDVTSDWTSPVSFTTDLCLAENECAINIALTDSYGDGWNGGQLSVVDVLTEEVLGTYTITSGSSANYTLNVCDGRDINIVYTAGNYPTENGWVVTAVTNEIISEHEGCSSDCAPTAGIQATYTVGCSTDCVKPFSLVAEPTENTATLSWEGYQESYNVKYRTAAYADPYFYEGFENGIPEEWTGIDADGDGQSWLSFTDYADYAHSGNGFATSASYSGSPLTPDNWLITPQLDLQGTMKVWLRAQDPNYAEEHFAIYLSTTGNAVEDFTTTLVEERYDLSGEYMEITADLSEYEGQQGYIAIRHFNCTDMFRINVDDFGIYGEEHDAGEWVTVTVDEATLDLTDLEPNTKYEWQVEGINEECTEDLTSATAYFTTDALCGIVLNAMNYYKWEETFESYDVEHTDGGFTNYLPKCWTLVREYTGASPDLNNIGLGVDTLPQVFYYPSFDASTGNQTLRMKFHSLVAMPELDESVDMSRLHLSMYVRQPQTYYHLQVGVLTDLTDDSTFEPLVDIDNESTDMEQFELDFSSYQGEGRYIAFKNVGGSSRNPYCTQYLDDIVLTYNAAPEACGISSLAYDEGFEGYTINPGATGVEPDCWEVIDEISALDFSTKPQLYAGFNTTEGGNYTLRMLNRCVYAMPELSSDIDVNTLTMTFNLRQPKAVYRLQVGVLDADNNFELVEEIDNASADMEDVRVDFTDYTGNGHRIAFRNVLNGRHYKYSYNYLDDIHIDLTANMPAPEPTKSISDMTDGADEYLNRIAVYPNPTTGMLHIDAVDVQKVECYNQMGKLVGVYDNVNELNISELANGVYMLRITVPQGVTMRKVVKR